LSIRRLFVHIGSHKTGTTTIQECLASSGSGLARAGLTFFYGNRKNGRNELPQLHSWIGYVKPRRIVPHGMRVKNLRRLAARLGAIGGDVVISSENFSFFFEPENVNALAEALRPVFDEIRIICYLRRQDRHVISHHQEGAKLNRAAEYDLFGHSTLAIPPYREHHRLYLDYHAKLSMWADAFGEENLILRIFDRRLLRNGDVTDDFFHLLGVRNFVRVPDRNLSSGFQRSKLGHLVLAGGFRHTPGLLNLVASFEESGRKMRPSRAAAEAYYAHFAESNAALNARFGISPNPGLFDEDFSDYPEEAEDIWDEERAGETCMKFLQALDDVYAELSPAFVLRAADLLAGEDPALARSLLRMAVRLRPMAGDIADRLADLEASD